MPTVWTERTKPSTSYTERTKPTTSWTEVDLEYYLLMEDGNYLLAEDSTYLVLNIERTVWTERTKP